MSKIYSELAGVYEQMYLKMHDYKKEFDGLNSYLLSNKCHRVCEVGCGGGSMSQYFFDEKFDYSGMDLSSEMIEICIKKHESNKERFFVGDMGKMEETFQKNEFDAVCITGKSFTHMLTNKDALQCLKSVKNVLKKGGILLFENFDAEFIFGNFKTEYDNTVEYESVKYRRISKTHFNLDTGFTWNWDSEYIIEEKGKEKKVVNDSVVLRAYLKEEIKLLVKLSGLKLVENVGKGYYFLTVARKEDE